MSLIVGTNSYVTLEEAVNYFAARMYSAAWDAATSGDKEASLLQATRMLDENFFWAGEVTVGGQDLRWPRTGIYDMDGQIIASDLIPQAIKNATCEQALYLLTLDPTQKPSLTMQGFKTASAGNLSVEADRNMIPDLIAPMAFQCIGLLGSPRPGARVAGLYCGRVERG